MASERTGRTTDRMKATCTSTGRDCMVIQLPYTRATNAPRVAFGKSLCCPSHKGTTARRIRRGALSVDLKSAVLFSNSRRTPPYIVAATNPRKQCSSGATDCEKTYQVRTPEVWPDLRHDICRWPCDLRHGSRIPWRCAEQLACLYIPELVI